MALSLLLGLTAVGPARSADTEVRTYTVGIDGRPAGTYTMTIVRQDDGTIHMAGQCETQVRFAAVLKFAYSYQGTEVWKEGRLIRFDSSTNDNGKRLRVQAATSADGLTVTANGQAHPASADSWVTTYWALPRQKLRDAAIPLLDGDTGRIIAARLDRVGPARVMVAGQPVDGSHYRVSGGAQVELWYDSLERLVRQEWTEDGHKATLDLVRVQR